MGMPISFAWTTPAVVSERKTRTRRTWKDSYAKKFKKGDICPAYDRQARFGGKRIKTIILTRKPFKQDIRDMPNEDYIKEGFKFFEEQNLKIWGKEPRQAFEEWRSEGGIYWVIDFDYVK